MLWPAKIVDADIPTYMVTIELKWAYRLFDETFAKETLFGAEKELMLNRQNIYYRSAKSSVERGRILWYVTKDERHQWSGGIRACSHIDEVVVGKPEELFRKFRRMGVYTWEDVLQTAKEEDNTIMAIRFSNTESFVQPIPLTQLREIYTEEGTTFQAQGIKRISKDLFARLYRIGKNLMPM
jgi:predicted transcriptional regulator